MVVVTVLDVPSVCPTSLAVTNVLFIPLISPARALTVSVTLVLAPAASVTWFWLMLDGSKFTLLLSVADRSNVMFEQAAPVSLLVMDTVYATFPPSVTMV